MVLKLYGAPWWYGVPLVCIDLCIWYMANI